MNNQTPASPASIGRRLVLCGLPAVAAVGAFALLKPRGASAASGPTVGSAAPGFQVTDSAGRTRTLAQFAGKTVVLEWTSPSCPFVRAQYDSGSMQALQREAVKRGVVWLSAKESAQL